MSDPLPPRSSFVWYVASSSLWAAAISLEGLIVTWLLIGVLEESASVYGESRALIAIPPLVLLIIGGVFADRVNPRMMLFIISIAAVAVPLLLLPFLKDLQVYVVVVFGTTLALLNALGDPARHATVSRVTRMDIQRSIVIITVVPSVIGIFGMLFGTQLERLGIQPILLILAALFLSSALTVLGIPKLSPILHEKVGLREGWRSFCETYLVRRIISMNFVNSIFNAGGYIIAMPLIATRVYDGDAAFLTFMFVVYAIGRTGSNVVLFFFMPLSFPGRTYILLQLTRALIIVGILLQPNELVFLGLVGLWGLNMGVTSTLVRTTVQELSPAEHRAKILSFYLSSYALSAPVSALLLGWLIEFTDPLIGLLPAIPISIGIFLYGRYFSGLWQYRAESNPLVQPSG